MKKFILLIQYWTSVTQYRLTLLRNKIATPRSSPEGWRSHPEEVPLGWNDWNCRYTHTWYEARWEVGNVTV